MLGKAVGSPLKAILSLTVVLGGVTTGAYVYENQEDFSRQLARLAGKAVDDASRQLSGAPLAIAEATLRTESGRPAELLVTLHARTGEQAHLNATRIQLSLGDQVLEFVWEGAPAPPPNATTAALDVLRDRDASLADGIVAANDLAVLRLPLDALDPAPQPRDVLSLTLAEDRRKPLYADLALPGTLAGGFVPLAVEERA
jgi:hypothetical protein